MNFKPIQMESYQNQNSINTVKNSDSYVGFNNNFFSSKDKIYTNQPNNDDEGEAPPTPFYAQNQINSTEQTILSNIDNNMSINKKSCLNVENTETNIKGENNNINPNIEYNKVFYENKETQNNSTTKGDVNPNCGKGNIFQEEEKKKFDVPNFGNFDNNIGNNYKMVNNNAPTNFGNFDNNIGNNYKMVNNNTPTNFGNLENNIFNNNQIDNKNQNLNDSKEGEEKTIIKRKIFEKCKEGFFPLFIRMNNQKPFFYYMKLEQKLSTLLKIHLNNIKIDDINEENYFFYNEGEILNPDVPIQNLGIKILSVIEIRHLD